MKNILLWAGIAVLAFQDYFKKQPVKPTKRQQFLQTGETSQAFIAGDRKFTKDEVLISKIKSLQLGLDKQLQKAEQLNELVYSNFKIKRSNKYWNGGESMFKSKKKIIESIEDLDRLIEWLQSE